MEKTRRQKTAHSAKRYICFIRSAGNLPCYAAYATSRLSWALAPARTRRRPSILPPASSCYTALLAATGGSLPALSLRLQLHQARSASASTTVSLPFVHAFTLCFLPLRLSSTELVLVQAIANTFFNPHPAAPHPQLTPNRPNHPPFDQT